MILLNSFWLDIYHNHVVETACVYHPLLFLLLLVVHNKDEWLRLWPFRLSYYDSNILYLHGLEEGYRDSIAKLFLQSNWDHSRAPKSLGSSSILAGVENLESCYKHLELLLLLAPQFHNFTYQGGPSVIFPRWIILERVWAERWADFKSSSSTRPWNSRSIHFRPYQIG